jgi:hypothetical protein
MGNNNFYDTDVEFDEGFKEVLGSVKKAAGTVAKRVKGLLFRKSLVNLQLLDLPQNIYRPGPLTLIGTNIQIGTNKFKEYVENNIEDLEVISMKSYLESSKKVNLTDDQILRACERLSQTVKATVWITDKGPQMGPCMVAIPKDRLKAFIRGKEKAPEMPVHENYTKIIIMAPKFLRNFNIESEDDIVQTFMHEYGHFMTYEQLTDRDWVQYMMARQQLNSLYNVLTGREMDLTEIPLSDQALFQKSYFQFKPEILANQYGKVNEDRFVYITAGAKPPANYQSHPLFKFTKITIPDRIINMNMEMIKTQQPPSEADLLFTLDWTLQVYGPLIPANRYKAFRKECDDTIAAVKGSQPQKSSVGESVMNNLFSFDNVVPVFTEAVFTKGSARIKLLEKCFDDLQKQYKKVIAKEPINRDSFQKFLKDDAFKYLEKTIIEVFGVRSVDVYPLVVFGRNNKELMDAYTYVDTRARFVIDAVISDEGFYDKTHTLHTVMNISSNLFDKCTPRQMVAVFLHEFGHNIDPKLVKISYDGADYIINYLIGKKAKADESKSHLKRYGISDVATFALSFFDKLLTGGFASVEKKTAQLQYMAKQNKLKLDHLKDTEAFADNMARMYGYGADLATVFRIMNENNEGDQYEVKTRTGKERARQKAILDMAMDSITRDVHGTDMQRIRALIAAYEEDLKDPNIPAKVKKQMKDDLDGLRQAYAMFTNSKDEFRNKVNQMIQDELEKEYNPKKGKKVTESFEDLEDGIYFDEEANMFLEKSHGDLKNSFRICGNVENGHLLKVVFSLRTAKVDMIGDHTHQNPNRPDPTTLKDIKKKGHSDFSATSIVQAIIDMDTGKHLQSADTIGVLGTGGWLNQMFAPDRFEKKLDASDFSPTSDWELDRKKYPQPLSDPHSGGEEFYKYPVKEREKIAEKQRDDIRPQAIRLTVGQPTPMPVYQSTNAVRNARQLVHSIIGKQSRDGSYSSRVERGLDASKRFIKEDITKTTLKLRKEYNDLRRQDLAIHRAYKADQNGFYKQYGSTPGHFSFGDKIDKMFEKLRTQIRDHKDERLNREADSHVYAGYIEDIREYLGGYRRYIEKFKKAGFKFEGTLFGFENDDFFNELCSIYEPDELERIMESEESSSWVYL